MGRIHPARARELPPETELGEGRLPPRGTGSRHQHEFRFDDPDQLIEWLSPDRGLVTLADAEQTTSRQPALTDLVRRWVRAG